MGGPNLGTESPDSITAAIFHLRQHHALGLSQMPQASVIEALCELASRWRDPNYALRQEAEGWDEPFPWAMVRVSLDALLESLTPAALHQLIASEHAEEAQGCPFVGHVIAANTPLLAWVSVIRALLVRSASFVKLPSGPAAHWGRLFHRSLAEISPALAACVHLAEWPGGTTKLDSTLCTQADLIMAQGSDETISALRALCAPGMPFIGYGHRVSFGFVADGWGTMDAAHGLAQDVLLYDQGGCLSPQTIFVEGDWETTVQFGSCLAAALEMTALKFPLPKRLAQAAGTVRTARDLARMEAGCKLWEDPALRWTVIARPVHEFVPSPTFGVISVQPIAVQRDLPAALVSVAPYLQGCAVAGGAVEYLPGVSRLCAPGELQAPPLAWRQDGRDVLRVLLPLLRRGV